MALGCTPHDGSCGSGRPLRAWRLLVWLLPALLAALLGACSRRDGESPATAGKPGGPATLRVLAGSELRDVEPALLAAARAAGVEVTFSYAGSLDIVERINAGEPFDAILPASGAYPALALQHKPLAREKLFYSRVALGVKAGKLRELGWDRQRPSWRQIAEAAGSRRLTFAMTNPTSSNSGMSALFAVACAVAGKTEDLTAAEVDGKLLSAFLSGQKLTAGSSGWLAEAYVRDPAAMDAMVNYEAVILRSNAQLPETARLTPVYPVDGVITADHPLMLLQAERRAEFDRLVAAWREESFQRQVADQAFLRPARPGVAPPAALSTDAVAELAFPNRLEVIDAVLGRALAQWRQPATSIFVLDVSGSMRGERLEAMRHALAVLSGTEAGESASQRYAAFQNRERVHLITFSNEVGEAALVHFEPDSLEASRQRVLDYARQLYADGGTAIYAALLKAQSLAEQERQHNPSRYISIVLLTDGENNAGQRLADYRSQMQGRTGVRVFPILFGEANTAEMEEVAQLSGGRVFDGRKAALALVFKEIRGYQ